MRKNRFLIKRKINAQNNFPGSELEFKGIEVLARKDESSERMIKRFMKKVRKEGVLQEYVDKGRFMKKSEKIRRKKMLAMWNSQKEQ